jgi:hypothetical protein
MLAMSIFFSGIIASKGPCQVPVHVECQRPLQMNASRGPATRGDCSLGRREERPPLLSDDVLSNDVDEVAQRQVHVDAVRAPARVDVPVRLRVAADVVRARIGRVAVDS